MPQITAALTINNGAATPVAKTFGPERVTPELAVFTERSAGFPAGYSKVSLAYSPTSSKRPTTRVEFSVDVPKTAVVNGVSSVVGVGRFRGYFVTPDNFSDADAADLHAYAVNALNHAQLKLAVTKNDPPY